MRGSLMTAAEQLTRALVDLATQGRRPRCGEPGGHELWTSDDADDRAQAATWCNGCPVLAECAASADEHDEKFGVFGGRDRTPAPPAKKTNTEGERPLMPRRNHRPKRTTVRLEPTVVEGSPSTDRLAHILVERGLASTAVLGPRPTYGTREATP